MKGATAEQKAIKRIYYILTIISIPSLIAIFVIKGSAPVLSAFVGILFLTGMLASWHITARYMVQEDPPGWTPIVIILRYALLGGLFYAIIHGRLVLWGWFVFGSIFVILAISLSTVLDIFRK